MSSRASANRGLTQQVFPLKKIDQDPTLTMTSSGLEPVSPRLCPPPEDKRTQDKAWKQLVDVNIGSIAILGGIEAPPVDGATGEDPENSKAEKQKEKQKKKSSPKESK